MNRNSATLIFAAATVLAACETPQPVVDLTTRTSANVSQIGSYLTDLSTTTRNLSAARAHNVASLKATVREVRNRYALDVALTKKTSDSFSRQQEIVGWIAEAQAASRGLTAEELAERLKTGSLFENAADQVGEDVKAIMDSLEALDAKTSALDEVAKTLGALAKQDDPEVRAKFLVDYVLQVREGVEANRKAAEEAANAAKATASATAQAEATATATASTSARSSATPN